MARRYGATDEELETLGDPDRSPLPPPERAAIRFAERMTLEPAGMDRAGVDALREHWEPAACVEIACVAGTFNYLNRFAEAFGLWPTRPGEGGPEDPFESAGPARGTAPTEGASE